MHLLLGTILSIVLVAGLASAGEDKKEPSAQSQRMTECNGQAADAKLTGDARKHFMAECLKAHEGGHAGGAGAAATSAHDKHPGDGHSAQAEKMKTCNQEATAKSLHGDDRRQFMSQCLKGDKKS